MHPELASIKCGFIKIDTEGYESNVHRFLTEKAQAGELPLKHPNWAEAETFGLSPFASSFSFLN